MPKIKCESCGCEYEYEYHVNHIIYCPHCRQYSFLECEYGYGPVVPCFICLGTDVIGTVTYNERADYEYRFDSEKYGIHMVLKHRYLEALEEAKDIVTGVLTDENTKNRTLTDVKDKTEKESRKESKKGKFFEKDIWLLGAAFVFAVTSLFIPPSGGSALIDEFCDVLAIAAAGAYISLKTVKHSKKMKVTVIALCALVCILFAKAPVMDMASETHKTVLLSPSVEKQTGYAGIISLKYYLRGIDEKGDNVRIRISGNDYDSLRQIGNDEIKVEYYPFSSRLFRYEI